MYAWHMLDSRLNYVVAVARCGSFTAAARSAGVTQSAITRSIADLEDQIGFAVFYRTSRGVILTEEGRDFVTRVTRLLEDAREILDAGSGDTDPFAGVLRIGVCPASLEWLVVEPLGELLKKHGGIRYDMTASNFETIVHLLRAGTLDVALGFDAAFREWSDLRRAPMGTLKSTLFVRHGHPLLSKQATRRDLADYDFVSPSESRPYGEVVRNLFEDCGIDWHGRVHYVDYFPLVRQIVDSSDAVGIVALSLANSERFQKHFGIIREPDLFPAAPLCCAMRTRWQPKPIVRKFIGAIQRSFPATR